MIALSTDSGRDRGQRARVAGTGIAAHASAPSAAEGFFHEFSGWMVFVVAFLLMMALQRVIVRFSPPRPIRPVPRAAVIGRLMTRTGNRTCSSCLMVAPVRYRARRSAENGADARSRSNACR